MISRTRSCALRGVGGVPVTVEVDVASGLPSFTIVGLTDRAIQEARERVRAAIRNAGFAFPQQRVTVNLAPAEVPKEGTGFDLAIALAVLSIERPALGQDDVAALGELSLDGDVRPVVGILPMARCLRDAGCRRLLVAAANGAEAGLVSGVDAVAVPSLRACVDHLEGGRSLPMAVAAPTPQYRRAGLDLAEIHGQPTAKRALEIAAAGRHNLLLLGPPGSGKTMLARALPSLLPDLDAETALEVAAVYSLRGALAERPPVSRRPPFRSPHHSVSRAGLVGGGTGLAQPGEISLAHHGVLFLDEVCEFPRAHLEALRQPLEEGTVTLVRSRGTVTLPARFTLVAASNPCPCGRLGSGPCGCDPRRALAYRSRLSGPLRDRIDLVIDVPRQPGETLLQVTDEEPSSVARGRVEAAECFRSLRLGEAIDRRADRLAGSPRRRRVLADARAGREAGRLLVRAAERLQLSARGIFRVVDVARTIADLAGEEEVGVDAVGEALRFRSERELDTGRR